MLTQGEMDMTNLRLSDTMPLSYLLGKLPPNHSVPAIRLEVDICQTWDNTVAIFECDTNKIVYGLFDGDLA